MASNQLKREIEITTKYISKGFSEQMKNLTRLQGGIDATNKVASRLATGKGSARRKDLEASTSFLSSTMSSFQKTNLMLLSRIEANTRGASFTTGGTEGGKPKAGFMERLFGDIENRKTKGLLRTKTNIFTPTGATSPGGMMTSLLTSISPMIVVGIGLLVSIAAVIIGSSKMLQRTLGNIMKYIMMFIRPIGDMIAVLFYPLMMVLRPLALLINTMLRPYLQTARQWYRTGLQQQSMAKRAERLGSSDEDVKALNDMAAASFGEGTKDLGLGFSSFMSEIIGNISFLITDIVAGLIALIPGVGDAAKNAAIDIKKGISEWKEEIQNTNLLSLYNSQQELAGAMLVNTHLNTYISLGERLKAQGGEYKTVIEGISPAIQEIADTYVREGGIAASKVAALWAIKVTEMLVDNGILSKSWNEITTKMVGETDFLGLVNDIYWKNQIINIGKAEVKFGELFEAIETKSNALQDKLSGINKEKNTVKIKPEGGLLEEIMGIFGGLVFGAAGAVGGNAPIAQMIGQEKWDNATNAMLIKMALLRERYTSEQIRSGDYGERAISEEGKSGKAIGGSIDQNGTYYLHRGETVVNPVDSSFSNSSGGSGGGGDININMSGSSFGNFSEWKTQMDKYFMEKMRHMR